MSNVKLSNVEKAVKMLENYEVMVKQMDELRENMFKEEKKIQPKLISLWLSMSKSELHDLFEHMTDSTIKFDLFKEWKSREN